MKLTRNKHISLSNIFLIGCAVVLAGSVLGDWLRESLVFIVVFIGLSLIVASSVLVLRNFIIAFRDRKSTGNDESRSEDSDKDHDTQERSLETALSKLKSVPWSVSDAVAITIAAFIGGQTIGIGSVALYLSITEGVDVNSAVSTVGSSVGLLFLGYAIAHILAVTLVLVFAWYRRGGLSSLGFRSFRLGRALGFVTLFFVGYILAATLAVAILDVLNLGIDFQAQQDIGFLDATSLFEMVLAFIALVILAPFAEELVFRGVLLPALTRAVGVVAAVGLSSVVFGLMHPPVNAMIGIGIFAVFLALIYIYTDSIWPAIFLHSLKNIMAFIAIFFADELLEYLEELANILPGGGWI